MPERMAFRYVFRRPVFPVICNIDGALIAAESDSDLQHQLARIDLKSDGRYRLIDKSSEGWEVLCQIKAISPLIASFSEKKWTKLRLIELYNNSRGVEKKYSSKSLSAKRFDAIFMDLVALITGKEKKTGQTRAARSNRKLSEIIIEIAMTAFKDEKHYESELMRSLALLAVTAWNSDTMDDDPVLREELAPIFAIKQPDKARMRKRLISDDLDAIKEIMLNYKLLHYPEDQRKIMYCRFLPDMTFQVEWTD